MDLHVIFRYTKLCQELASEHQVVVITALAIGWPNMPLCAFVSSAVLRQAVCQDHLGPTSSTCRIWHPTRLPPSSSPSQPFFPDEAVLWVQGFNKLSWPSGSVGHVRSETRVERRPAVSSSCSSASAASAACIIGLVLSGYLRVRIEEAGGPCYF